MGLKPETQIAIIGRMALRGYIHTEDAANDAACERLAAAVGKLRELGVRVVSHERFFGWRKMAAYYIPVHTDSEMRAIFARLTQRQFDNFGYLVKCLARHHPRFGLGEPPMVGTNEPTMPRPHEDTLGELILDLLKGDFISAREVRLKLGTSRLSVTVDILRSKGVEVDDYWVYRSVGHPYKRFHVFTDPQKRIEFLANRPETQRKAREESDAARAKAAEARKERDRLVKPRRLSSIARNLETARIELICALFVGAGERRVMALRQRVYAAAELARLGGALRCSPEDVVERCMAECPGRLAEPVVSVAGDRLESVDRLLDRQDLLVLWEMSRLQEIERIDQKLAQPCKPPLRLRLQNLRDVYVKQREAVTEAFKVVGVLEFTADELLQQRIAAFVGQEVRAYTVVEFEGRTYRREFEKVLNTRGELAGWRGHWALLEASTQEP